jgi:hypothetical protein
VGKIPSTMRRGKEILSFHKTKDWTGLREWKRLGKTKKTDRSMQGKENRRTNTVLKGHSGLDRTTEDGLLYVRGMRTCGIIQDKEG